MNLTINPLNEELLFRTTVYTDGVAGSLHVQEAYNFDGQRVFSRPTIYLGITQLQTTRGPLTVNFVIEASTLREAFEKWAATAKDACEKSIGDIQAKALRDTILSPGGKRT